MKYITQLTRFLTSPPEGLDATFVEVVRSYVIGGRYYPSTSYPKVISLVVEGLSDDEVADMVGLSRNRTRTLRQEGTKALAAVLPVEFFSLAHTDPDSAKRLFTSAVSLAQEDLELKVSPVFLAKARQLSQGTALVRGKSAVDYPTEVATFLKYSKASMDRDLASCSPEGLAYVLSLLDSSSPNLNIADRRGLASRL